MKDEKPWFVRLREMRTAKRMTQRDLAEAIPVSQPAYSDWEKGKAQPSAVEMLAKLAVLLETSTDYLLGLSDAPALRRTDSRPYDMSQPLTRGDLDDVIQPLVHELFMLRAALVAARLLPDVETDAPTAPATTAPSETSAPSSTVGSYRPRPDPPTTVASDERRRLAARARAVADAAASEQRLAERDLSAEPGG